MLPSFSARKRFNNRYFHSVTFFCYRSIFPSLLRMLFQICKEKNLQAVEPFLQKIIQVYEMMIVRHGFMLVGDPYGGKTAVLQVERIKRI